MGLPNRAQESISPSWSGGAGSRLQTVTTFFPPIFHSHDELMMASTLDDNQAKQRVV